MSPHFSPDPSPPSQVRATTPRLTLTEGGATEAPLPDELRRLIDAKLSCKELKGEEEPTAAMATAAEGRAAMPVASATPTPSSSSALSSRPWCSTAYRDDVKGFLDKLVSMGGRQKEVGAGGGERTPSMWWWRGFTVARHFLLSEDDPHLPQVKQYSDARERMGLPASSRGAGEGAATLEYASGLEGLTRRQLDSFITQLLSKYEAKRIDPGG